MSTHNTNNTNPQEVNVSGISSARKLLIIIIIATLIVGIGYWFVENEETSEPAATSDIVVEEPQFEKEGNLFFLNQGKQGDTLARIAIEVADNEEERTQGLMHRSQMADSLGMLFIFENAEPRSFWMKNTKIPLDILYVGDNKEIVMVYKSVMPYSKQSVPSYKDARYVVEVIGGFTTEHNIKEGDYIAFHLQQ